MAKSLGRMTRGMSLAGGLALGAALLAMPVAATDGSDADAAVEPEVAVDSLTLDRPVLMDSGHVIDWSRALAATEDLHWTTLLPDGDVDHETHGGVTPLGVEWTRSTRSHPTGVEWTRLRASDPDGSSWVETSVSGTTGVEWSFMTYQGADGSSWTESRFLDTEGRAWSRSAPGSQLDGVEWT